MNGEITKAIQRMQRAPVRNYVLPGLTSYLIGGEGHGQVRLLESDRDTREFVTPHSHRFDFTCLVLAGTVTNVIYRKTYRKPGSNLFSLGHVTPVQGGLGRYEVRRDVERFDYIEEETTYDVNATYAMTADQIHSIRFSRDARVLFFEGPEKVLTSTFLEPVSDGRVVPTFETRAWMFERPAEQMPSHTEEKP